MRSVRVSEAREVRLTEDYDLKRHGTYGNINTMALFYAVC